VKVQNKLIKKHFSVDKLISIIVPSRGRKELIEDFLQSIEDNTKNKKRVQVITVTDVDSIEDTTNILNYYNENNLTFDLYNVVRPQSIYINEDYYNFAYQLTNSYFVWGLGNDCKIITKDWDEIFYNKTKPFFQNILENKKYYYIHIYDDIHKTANEANCFPILSSNYCDKVREMLPCFFKNWTADTYLWENVVSKNLDKFEVVDLIDNIAIEHICIHNNKYKTDSVHKELKANNHKNIYHPKYAEVLNSSTRKTEYYKL
jgi:hypothetical protein